MSEKEQNKPETKIAAQNHSGFNLYSMTDTAYEKYLSFIEGANWMNGQLYTADQCAKMLEALRQRCAEEIKLGDTVLQLKNKIRKVEYHDLIPLTK